MVRMDNQPGGVLLCSTLLAQEIYVLLLCALPRPPHQVRDMVADLGNAAHIRPRGED